MKPSKKNITKWVRALRSGDYTQGRKELETTRGNFCCLGVACEVFIPRSKQEVEYRNGDDRLIGGTPHDQRAAPLWLRDVDEDFSNRSGQYLVELNDVDKLTFDEIADLLEAVYILEVLS